MLEKFIEYMEPLDKCIRHGDWCVPSYSDLFVANRTRSDSFGWEMSSSRRFNTPDPSLSHDCSPNRGLHVHRDNVGVVHRSRARF
jgi:hypothetical protein